MCDVKWIIVVTNLRLKQCCYVSDFLKMLTNIFLFKYWLGDTSKRRESFFAISSRQPMATNRSENSGGKLKIWHLFPYLRWIYHRRTSMQPQWQSSPWKKNLILLIFRIPPGFWGHRARFACLFGLLASSFTLDHHERHKSLFFAKSRKNVIKIWQPSLFTQFTQKQTILVHFWVQH